LLWMGLFAGIIFAEKIWSKGMWIARVTGFGLIVFGALFVANMVPPTISPVSSMSGFGGDIDSMTMTNPVRSLNNDSNEMDTSGINSETSMNTSNNSGRMGALSDVSNGSDSKLSVEDGDNVESMENMNITQETVIMKDMK